MRRPVACPNCGAPCTQHTGSYCHECGEPLTHDRPLRLRPTPDHLRERPDPDLRTDHFEDPPTFDEL